LFGSKGGESPFLYFAWELRSSLKTFISEAFAGTNYNCQHDFASKPIDVKPGITKVKNDNSHGKYILFPVLTESCMWKPGLLLGGPRLTVTDRRHLITSTVN